MNDSAVSELTTTFAEPIAEDRLDNLTLWLDQTSFSGFGDVDYRFTWTSERTIHTRIGQRITLRRLEKLCAAVDVALAGIVRDVAFATTVTLHGRQAPELEQRKDPQSPTYGVLLDMTVMTDYGLFDLVWDAGVGSNGDPEIFAGQVNGLVGAGVPDGVCFTLARRSGGSRLTILSVQDAPPPSEVSWEDVVEVSVVLPSAGRVRWQTWAGESTGELPALSPGPHRLRVSARDRDRAASDDELDTYLVEIWPASWQPDAILRTTSANARYWHGARTNRPG